MSLSHRRHDESQHLVRHSVDSSSSDLELDDFEFLRPPSRHSKSLSLSSILPWRRRSLGYSPALGYGRSRWLRAVTRCWLFSCLFLVVLVLITPIINSSYSRRPAHYTGKNIRNEKVFIAANIVDEELIKGPWGKAIVELVELLGKDNVFLSIYENNSGPSTVEALQQLGKRVKCKTSIVSDHIDLDHFPSIQILPNDHRVKRILYLAKVRNMAIEPLTAANTGMKFDKLLFINDVIFSAKDAVDLLFSTNIGPDGKAQYHAACAMDFINPFKFYDTFASRDAEGYGLGVPFYPFFSNAGAGASRRDVLANKDAVRVKSCWGGMVAFEAKWFAQVDSSTEENEVGMSPIQFRASDELFWEASECCLVHADISAMASLHPEPWENHAEFDHGIYMNPYIRVAYDAQTHSWLRFTRRFERLYTWFQGFINWMASRPPFQPRRELDTGAVSHHQEWVYDGPADSDDRLAKRWSMMDNIRFNGHWETVTRVAQPGAFCGGRQLLVLKKHWAKGERMWERIGPPPGANDR